ncbi:MAG: hypothetical protein GSR72_04500 [Desulfurococcales archaeon]|nr:hypothetical protein [Desulfurococcales archaeon]
MIASIGMLAGSILLLRGRRYEKLSALILILSQRGTIGYQLFQNHWGTATSVLSLIIFTALSITASWLAISLVTSYVIITNMYGLTLPWHELVALWILLTIYNYMYTRTIPHQYLRVEAAIMACYALSLYH